MVTVRPATYLDVDPLAGTLARAFDQDALIDWIIRDDHLRAEGIRLFFRQCLNALTLPFGMVTATADRKACALWAPSEHVHLAFFSQLHLLPDMIHAAGMHKMPRFIETMQVLDQHHPRAPHDYLMFIGVDPAYQRQGRGLALMRAALEHCDCEGRPAYLENSNPENQPFYERLGFEAAEAIRVGRGGPVIIPMWREPQPVGGREREVEQAAV